MIRCFWSGVVFVVRLLTAELMIAQTGSQILSQELKHDDWGFKDVAEIRMGQVGVIHVKTLEQLKIYNLSNTLPPK
ncbi:MAG: hypothetical protein DMG06_27085, partial [Acidobacteria bacterium]